MTGTTFDGALELVVRGQSWKRRQKPPLTLSVLEWPDRLLAMAIDQSGGQRGGDRLRTDVFVGDQGRLDWLPPSSSLFFPSADRQKACVVETRLKVEAGSQLVWCPRVSIPCAGARVEQTTVLEVATGAELLFWDGWADGRTSAGERGAFASLSNRLELRLDGRLVFQERWTLTGTERAAQPDPAGFQGACQWYLGLAAGEVSRQALADRVNVWREAGERVEMGELDEDLWIARVLSQRPTSFAP